MTPEQIWPLFALELRTPRLRLRAVRDEDFSGLIDAALNGIHEPGHSPFVVDWASKPAAVLAVEFARHQWRQREKTNSFDWTIPFAVFEGDTAIGVQDLQARSFGQLHTVETGSWLTRSAQGRGLGTEMRAAVLQLSFDHFGADRAISGALRWNGSSQGVSRRLGYTANGDVRMLSPEDGTAVDGINLLLERENFVRPSWTLDVSGVDEARTFLRIE